MSNGANKEWLMRNATRADAIESATLPLATRLTEVITEVIDRIRRMENNRIHVIGVRSAESLNEVVVAPKTPTLLDAISR